MIISLLVLCPCTVNPDKVLDMEDIKFAEKIYTAYFCTGEVFGKSQVFWICVLGSFVHLVSGKNIDEVFFSIT